MERPDYDNMTDEDMKPRTWETLSDLERQIKVEEGILENMLKGLKGQKDNIYSRILIRLIELELKDPRL